MQHIAAAQIYADIRGGNSCMCEVHPGCQEPGSGSIR